MTRKTRCIDDPVWLANVRMDLDTDMEDWTIKTPNGSINKLQALGHYLDVILRELGHPPKPHKCPVCGKEHE